MSDLSAMQTFNDYEDHAEDYSKEKNQMWRIYVEKYSLLNLVSSWQGKTVLDLGCGDGVYSFEAKNLGASYVYGIDIAHSMIKLAREKAKSISGVEFAVADCTNSTAVSDVLSDAKVNTFDIIICSYVLNYVQNTDEMTSISRVIAHALAPDGIVIGINNNPDETSTESELFQKYGFDKVTKPDIKLWDPVIYHIYDTMNAEQSVMTIVNFYCPWNVLQTHLSNESINYFETCDLKVDPEFLSSNELGKHEPTFFNTLTSHQPIKPFIARRI